MNWRHVLLVSFLSLSATFTTAQAQYLTAYVAVDWDPDSGTYTATCDTHSDYTDVYVPKVHCRIYTPGTLTSDYYYLHDAQADADDMGGWTGDAEADVSVPADDGVDYAVIATHSVTLYYWDPYYYY